MLDDSADDLISFTAVVTNNGGAKRSFRLIAATYDNEGHLIGISLEEAAAAPGESTVITTEAKIGAEAAKYCRAFVWEDMTSLTDIFRIDIR